MKWGIWNVNTKRFCYGIEAKNQAAAYAAFNRVAPKNVRRHRCYTVRPIPRDWENPPNLFCARQRNREERHGNQ